MLIILLELYFLMIISVFSKIEIYIYLCLKKVLRNDNLFLYCLNIAICIHFSMKLL